MTGKISMAILSRERHRVESKTCDHFFSAMEKDFHGCEHCCN